MSAGAILDLSQDPRQSDRTVDVLVIGSGCAGATAARALARAGREVLVLEEGGDFTGEKLTQRDGRMYDQLYMDRSGRMTSDLSMSVLQGRVLGGSAVINASDVVPVSDELLRFWQKKYGLTDYGPEQLEPYRQRALADLRSSRIGDDQINRANRLLMEGAAKVGAKGEVMLNNRVGCRGLGTCLIGCPIGAKQNPRWVAIPEAVEAGATFLCRARAVRIEDGGAELKRVAVRVLDADGYHEVDGFTVKARVVILAANAIGSTHLALRSGLGNAHVGSNLSLQPQLGVVARFKEEVIPYRGIPQAFAVTEGERFDDERGLWGYRIEAIMGTPGIISALLPRVGPDVMTAMAAYNRIAASLVLVPDEPSGTVGVTKGGRVRIDYQHKDNHKERLREGAKLAARCYLAAGAYEVEIPTNHPVYVRSERDLAMIDAIPFDPCSAPLMSAHQQGGLRMAASEKDGACAPNGLLYGTRDVYCFDSGLYPSSSSSHTQAPILSTAHYLVERLLAKS
ncbi:MAG: GMC family oxidoreductase [Deltaproteobacteria bacterium]|nr:GMC family oxidoreductase [Deltaproteobacteria bacterium]